MQAARDSVSAPLDLFDSAGSKIGTIANANPIGDQIVDIGVTNLEHTQFNQTLSNLRKISTATTAAAPPLSGDTLNAALNLTNEAYGLGVGDLPEELGRLAQGGMAFDRVSADEKAAQYSEDAIRYALGYSDIDPLSRVTGVATARATAPDLARAIHIEGSSLSGLRGLASTAGERAVSDTTSVLRQLADLSPVSFAIGQGQEGKFGKTFTIGTGDPTLFEENLYFRMSAGQDAAQKSSDKITMLAEDFTNLEIQIGPGRRVKVGSEAFLKSESNRFIRSYVHPTSSGSFQVPETINLIFNPQNLTSEALDDLANQVVGTQVTRYAKTRLADGMAKSVHKDFNAITNRVFGTDDFETAVARVNAAAGADDAFLKLFEPGRELSQRVKMLQDMGLSEEAEKLNQYVLSQSREIKDDGIAAFKYVGESAEQIREIEKRSGNEALIIRNDSQTRSQVERMTSVVTSTSDDGTVRVLGATTSPSVSETATIAARAELGQVGDAAAEALRATDEHALQRLSEAVSVVPDIDSAAIGTMATESSTQAAAGALRSQTPIADEAVRAGSQFIKRFKTPVYLAGLAVATAVVGKKLAEKSNENQYYDRTMDFMPVESGQRPYGIQEASFSQKVNSRRKDPLFTAGVVGNLDRSKINHTSMGPDKNNHLYGG